MKTIRITLAPKTEKNKKRLATIARKSGNTLSLLFYGHTEKGKEIVFFMHETNLGETLAGDEFILELI